MRWMLSCALVAIVGCGSGLTRDEQATKLVREGEELALAEKTTEAIEKYREGVALQPQWIQARFDLARLEFQKGQTHFMNYLEHDRLAKAAKSAGDDETFDAERKLAREEKQIAEPLLREALSNLRRVLASGTKPANELNAYIWLGTIHADFEQYQVSLELFQKAKAMKPGGDAEAVIDQAIDAVNREIDKRAELEVGLPPE